MIRNCFTSRNPILRFSFLKRLYKNKLFRKQGLMVTSSVHDIAVKKEMLVDVNIKPINKFVSRTHTCGEIRAENVGENVRLHGWLEFSRANKFIILRDSYGSTQLIVSDNRKDLQDIVENLTFESILDVEGTVTKRPKDQENKKMKTGGIEINVKSIKVLNPAKPSIPFIIRKYNKAKEETQLKYRYISLRYPELQQNLRLRSKVIMKMREYLVNDCGFVDIETPTLFKNTPKGAQEFIVPTQMPGQFYSLVQSPQQLKQLLMVGGFDRYFQVAKCYRDETPRHDRQPEFTQIDIEMSFVDSEGVMDLLENLIKHSWPKASSEITIPFKRMKYDDAMELYGTDKPDLRIPQCIHKLTEVIEHSVLEVNLKVKPNENFEIYGLIFSQRQAHLTKSVKDMISQLQHKYYPHVTLVQTSISNKSSKIMEIIDKRVQHKLSLREGDVVFLACGEKVPTQSLLGKVRLEFANMLESKGETIRTTENELLWITDFPLFSLNSKTNALESMHHPFTQPHPDDIQHLTENPLKVKGLHYDLVMNGSEIAGGSIRIHNAKLQKKILKMLNIDESYLTHMIEALESGAPPHGGIAIGLDRLMCLLCNTKNIKNVIAFPKTMTGRDLMANAPSHLSEEEKMLYHIKTVDE